MDGFTKDESISNSNELCSCNCPKCDQMENKLREYEQHFTSIYEILGVVIGAQNLSYYTIPKSKLNGVRESISKITSTSNKKANNNGGQLHRVISSLINTSMGTSPVSRSTWPTGSQNQTYRRHFRMFNYDYHKVNKRIDRGQRHNDQEINKLNKRIDRGWRNSNKEISKVNKRIDHDWRHNNKEFCKVNKRIDRVWRHNNMEIEKANKQIDRVWHHIDYKSNKINRRIDHGMRQIDHMVEQLESIKAAFATALFEQNKRLIEHVQKENAPVLIQLMNITQQCQQFHVKSNALEVELGANRQALMQLIQSNQNEMESVGQRVQRLEVNYYNIVNNYSNHFNDKSTNCSVM